MPRTLLVEKGYPVSSTAGFHVNRPLFVLSTETGARLAAVNHPVDPSKVKVVKRAKGGFVTDEANTRRDITQTILLVWLDLVQLKIFMQLLMKSLRWVISSGSPNRIVL